LKRIISVLTAIILVIGISSIANSQEKKIKNTGKKKVEKEVKK